ncbi:MAG: OmpA family protein [Flavobacteriales bacterium]|nr:OmpA family protein [Flavobacteriales bacterium]MBT4704103.1 OmpA family protein [Flavobacteriales bacterium]MBT4930750.1 OmpA family protein [Flavobacteriales bacterium]MBT5132083.1 OmpA family protein [Flavobacteriales bacterium]MBT5977660.1 OmpA family protein [Flavobacteriales bacterium]
MRAFIGVCFCVLLMPDATNAQDTLSVYFDLDKRTLDNHTQLDAFARTLERHENIQLIGYADYLGSKSYNLLLSFDRAYHIAKYLRKNHSKRITVGNIEAKGELPPRGTNSSDGKPKDRRVDIVYGSSATPKQSAVPISPAPKQREVVSSPVKSTRAPEAIEIDTTSKENIVLEGLSFYGGRHYPLPESMPILLSLVETMMEYPTLEIEIHGHICCNYVELDGMDNDTGEPVLSRNRAQFVYEFLIENGINEDRMSFKGLGSSDPKVFPEMTPEDQQANRRVELKIIHF